MWAAAPKAIFEIERQSAADVLIELSRVPPKIPGENLAHNLEVEKQSAADVLIKLSRVLPKIPGENLAHNRKFVSTLLQIAATLPSHRFAGLGDEQRKVLELVLVSTHRAMRSNMERGRLDASEVDLLRSLASDTTEEREESEYGRASTSFSAATSLTSVHYLPHKFAYFREALCKAELFHYVNMRGLRIMKNNILGSGREVFYEAVDMALPMVTRSMVLWVFPILFDGLRLRCGLQIASELGVLRGGETQPFGLKGCAESVLTDGESVIDATRVARSVQFLLGAMRLGVLQYLGAEACGSRELALVELLETRIRSRLEACRQQHERICLVPGKQMRTILDVVCDFVENASMLPSPSTRNEEYDCAYLVIKLAFAAPCLRPSCLKPLAGYDGGDLSLWDACQHMLLLKQCEMQTTDSPIALVAQVLGGVIGGLTSHAIGGPFSVNDALLEYINSLITKWPSTKTRSDWSRHEEFIPESPCVFKRPIRRIVDTALPSGHTKGKHVGANQSICDAINEAQKETAHKRSTRFKSARPRTDIVKARAAAALTMQSVAIGFERGNRVSDTFPTDGITQLKRLYIVALSVEPGLPTAHGSAMSPNPFYEQPTARRSSVTTFTDSIETPWRDIVGGATLLVGPLYEFTKQAFKQTLLADWLPLECVKRALQDRAEGRTRRPQATMLPAIAMAKLANHGKMIVAEVMTEVLNHMHMTEGVPPRVKQALECFCAWASAMYDHAAYAPLWECCILHICSSSNGGRTKHCNYSCQRNTLKRSCPVSPFMSAEEMRRAVRASSPLSLERTT